MDTRKNAESQLIWLLDPLPIDSRVIISVHDDTCPPSWKFWPAVHLEELTNKNVEELLGAELVSYGNMISMEQQRQVLTHCHMPCTCLQLYVTLLSSDIARQHHQLTDTHGQGPSDLPTTSSSGSTGAKTVIQPTLEQTFKQAKAPALSTGKQKDLDDALKKMIVAKSLPLRLVDHETFRNFVHLLNSSPSLNETNSPWYSRRKSPCEKNFFAYTPDPVNRKRCQHSLYLMCSRITWRHVCQKLRCPK